MDTNTQIDSILWQHLSYINAAADAFPKPRYHTLAILEGMRDSVRSLIHKRIRPKIRPLNILDLPTELLFHIFKFVKYEDIDCNYAAVGPFEAYAIYDIRLTCHRFCEVSSSLLLHSLKVDTTPSTLAQLDEASRHPAFSKGVRHINLVLTPFYDSVLAHDFRAFARYQAAKLRGSVRLWNTTMAMGTEEMMQTTRQKGAVLAETWAQIAAGGVDPGEDDIISEAHKKYLRCYEDQQEYFASLPRAIASAMARMPTAKCLRIDSNSIAEYLSSSFSFEPTDLEETDSLLQHLLEPMGWDDARKFELPPSAPPLNLLGELLLHLQHYDVSLAAFDFFSPPLAIGSSTKNDAIINELIVPPGPIKRLETVAFGPPMDMNDTSWKDRTSEEWFNYRNFLGSLIHTKSLTNLFLDFSFMVTRSPPPQLSMASLLVAYKRPNLKFLDFCGPFHCRELQSIVKNLANDVELHWSGHLMSGTWFDVLEILRARHSKSQMIGGSSAAVNGQEVLSMTKREMEFIFGEYDGYEENSKATMYIRGVLLSNPVGHFQ